ncbi:MAG TPA: tautomerase family protein [Polyangiaceae bacterium]|nr:tautomerase family protein [Polyangiaceae bacterium]
MPHVIVKLYAGKSEQQKKELAEAMTRAVTSTLHYGEESVSVAIEDVAPERWAEDVYKPEILGKSDNIYKKPGYNHAAESPGAIDESGSRFRLRARRFLDRILRYARERR